MITVPSQPGRVFAPVAFALAMLMPRALGVDETLTARAVVGALRAAGFARAERATPTIVGLGSARYEICFRCTPATLCICGAALLWFARQSLRQYILTALAFSLGASVVVIGSIAASIGLHQAGVDWARAHFPLTSACYAGCLTACFAFSQVRRRCFLRLPLTN